MLDGEGTLGELHSVCIMQFLRSATPARAVLALSAACAVLTACGAPVPTSAPHFAAAGTELDLPVPATIRALPFTDQAGHTVHLSDFAGKTVVLGDMLTLCQEHCPIDTETLVLMARERAATPDPADTVFLSVTVDPTRDTPAQLAAYRRLYVGSPANVPQWELLTGSPANVAALWRSLHVYVQKVGEDSGVVRSWRTGRKLTYDVDHSDDVFFIDPAGRERYLFAGQPYLHGGRVPPAMQRFMSGQGRRNEQHGQWTAAEGLQVLNWLRTAPSGS